MPVEVEECLISRRSVPTAAMQLPPFQIILKYWRLPPEEGRGVMLYSLAREYLSKSDFILSIVTANLGNNF